MARPGIEPRTSDLRLRCPTALRGPAAFTIKNVGMDDWFQYSVTSNKNSAENYVAPEKDHVRFDNCNSYSYWILNLSTSSDDALYQNLGKYLEGFRTQFAY